MMGRNHMLVGAATWTAAAGAMVPFGLSPAAVIVGLPIAYFCALGPDIDEKGSKVSRYLGPLRHVIPPIVNKLGGGHRGFTHSLAGTALLWFALTLLGVPGVLVGPFIVGWASHMLGDMCTPHGVPWLHPFSKKCYSLDLFSTGEAIETGVVWAYVALCVLCAAVFSGSIGVGQLVALLGP